MKTRLAIATLLAALALAGCGGGEVVAKLAESGAANAIEREASEATSRVVAVVSARSVAGKRLPLTEATGNVAREAEPAAADVAGVTARVAASPEAESTLRSCTSGAIQDTAEAYADAVLRGEDIPDLSGVLTSSLSGCLSETYPDASGVIAAVTKVIEARMADASQEVVDSGATPQQYVAWLMSVASSVQ